MLGGRKTKSNSSSTKNIVTTSFAEQKRTCRTVLRGSMQNHAGLKNMCKKTRETCTGQSLKGGGGGGRGVDI